MSSQTVQGSVELLEATLSDLADLQALAIATFTETFGHDNSPEDLQTFFDQAYNQDILRQEILDDQSKIYLLREKEQAIGYLKVNWGTSQTEQELENGFEIQRIYLLQSHQGKGYGKLLFDHALTLASQSDQDWVWLGVWEHNYKAQAFYASYGFEKFSEHAFPVGDKVDVDWLLKKKIER